MRLTSLAKPPKARPGAAAPHQYRLLGGKVLISDDLGRRALLTKEEYARLLAGLDASDPLRPALSERGFVAGAYDFDEAARLLFERSLLSWKGPASHVLLLDGMGLDAARDAVEFAFRCPGPQVTLELVFADAGPVWPVVWFVVQYARRKGEWSRRPVFLIARARSMPPERADFLRSHGVARVLALDLDGAPDMSRAPAFRAQRARARVGPRAADPAAWADWLERWGFESARLLPSALDEAGAAAFSRFHAGFLDRLVERGEEAGLRDEETISLLAGRTWSLPGMDILEQLAYDAAGRVLSAEEGGLELGRAASFRYRDLPALPAVAAVLAASLADNQPLCSQCVYRAGCAVAPSAALRSHGTVWGLTTASAECAIRMGHLDRILERLNDEKVINLLNKWHVDIA